jgi:uncharacterized phiE125 gp8 family phage protein
VSAYQSAKHTTQTSRPTVVTGPATEPLTVNEAKRHLFLAQSDTSQNIELANRIKAAREQWEHDTDSVIFTQTLSVTADRFGGREIVLPSEPIQSVTHVKYYDDANVLQTLSTDLYSVDLPESTIRLVWNASWPTTYIRWDAITVTYVAGNATVAAVPEIAKQAMLLMVGYYHYGNRGDNDRQNDRRAYEALVRRYMRSSYP